MSLTPEAGRWTIVLVHSSPRGGKDFGFVCHYKAAETTCHYPSRYRIFTLGRVAPGNGRESFVLAVAMQASIWRVGVLFSETGVTGALERAQCAATLLAIDEINNAGGRECLIHGKFYRK